MENIFLLHSGTEFYDKYVSLINSAKDTICISTFRLENPENKKSKTLDKLYFALAAAARRNVRIEILVNLYDESRRLGQINKKSAGILRGFGCMVKRPGGNITNHAKILLVDNRRLILGSHNLTRHSFGNNFELSIYVENSPLCANTQGIFNTAYSLAMPV